MNRKTNLFYTSGQDSNFLTFSNFTEALTGNIIATNAKMFPSKFICMRIPLLNVNENFDAAKKNFIKNLIGYYENKLAFLRDKLPEIDKTVEDNLNPLDYLLDCIYNYDPSAVISHIGLICEQEYNGVFNDNICIIEASATPKEYTLRQGSLSNGNIPVECSSVDSLYGWENYNSIENFVENYGEPIYDNNNNYYNTGHRMKCSAASEEATSIDFNVLIPLFNVYDWELNTQNPHYYDLQNDEEYSGKIDSATSLVIDSGGTKNHYDIPLGIWISDKLISLDRSSTTPGAYRPSWSLCISSQFKPFPYSDKYPNSISESDNLDIYGTFAMIMSKQGLIANEFETLTTSITNITYRIDNITNVVNNIINEGVGGNGGSSGSGSGSSGEHTDADLTDITNRLDRQSSLISNISNTVANLSESVSILQNSNFVTQEYVEQHYAKLSDLQDYAKASDLATLESTITNTSTSINNINIMLNASLTNMNAYNARINTIAGIGEQIEGKTINFTSNVLKLGDARFSLREVTVGYMTAYNRIQLSVAEAVSTAENANAAAITSTNAFSSMGAALENRLAYLKSFLEDRLGGFDFEHSTFKDGKQFEDIYENL